MLKENILLVR